MKWYQPRTPDKIEPIPWLHPDVIDYFAGILRPDMDAIEQGCGGSTIWLAKLVRTVLALDDALEWVYMVKHHLDKAGYTHASVNHWPDPNLFPPIHQKYDLAFVDGSRAGRVYWMQHIAEIVKPGGWLVLDNANRPEYQDTRAALMKIAKLEARFDRNENGTRYLVTEFWRLN